LKQLLPLLLIRQAPQNMQPAAHSNIHNQHNTTCWLIAYRTPILVTQLNCQVCLHAAATAVEAILTFPCKYKQRALREPILHVKTKQQRTAALQAAVCCQAKQQIC
jgi:hypothetical protein